MNMAAPDGKNRPRWKGAVSRSHPLPTVSFGHLQSLCPKAKADLWGHL